MAATLQNSAAGTVNRGQPCSYYGKDMKTNPVFQALEQEMKQYVGYMKKRSAPGFKKPTEEPSSRAADALFELWNKYEPRLPMDYYQEKLLEMGDFLVSIKEYKLALWQCYGRYLENFGDVNVEQITDVETFKSVFFPDGFDAANAGLTFRALMGKAICMYQVVKLTDPKLQNPESVDNCTQLLSFLRLVTQVVLPKEPLCWLVYNGTIHIYSVSRHLMSLGYSAKVLEYLLWACMCMEGSVPLLSVRYLPWRSTLYTAVCQCYYDCKAAPHAEAFARRAISKVNELSQLEHMSSAKESKQTESTFKQATTKLGIMVFKRSAFETRKRPKGLLRPKTRANLKDAQTLPWPRTPTERLLADMFEGSAAQFMCIIETLTDSNRRTLLTAPPAPDSEVEMLDVYAELFMAAQEIIAGGGGNALQSPANPTMIRVPGMAGVVTNNALIDMVGSGEDGVPLSGVIKLVKLAYCYEQWDLFDLLTENVQAYLKEINDTNYKYDEKAIEILKAMENASSSRKVKRQPSMHFSEDESAMLGQEPTLPPPPTTAPTASARPGGLQHDELIQVADVLLSVIAGSFNPEKMDLDMIVDAALFLWNKCKSVFQKYQTGSTENAKYLQKMENASKWVYILDIVHQVLGWCGMSSVDPTLTAEVVVRLALVMEASATLDATEGKDKKMTKSKSVITSAGRTREDEDGVTVVSGVTRDLRKSEASPSRGEQSVSAPILKAGARQQLLAAREILELGLSNVSFARQAVALTDGKSIADIGWVKELNEDLFAPMTWKEIEEGPSLEEFDPNKSRDANSVMNAIRDLHLELIFMHHRVSLKLAAMGPDPALKAPKPFKRRTCSKIPGSRESMRPVAEYIEDFDELISMCNKNQLSKALLYMQRAWMASSDDQPTAEQKDLLQNSVNLITQAQTEEKKMYIENAINGKVLSVKKSKVPPPPILLCRTDATMVFQPAPFEPPNGQKVAWYRLFGRSATGSNVKVRLNDYFLPGTGEEILAKGVPSFHCELRVSGLTPNERYVFAVAAYTADGKLIGGSVGETGKPILAAHPLPVLMTWGFLSQVAYQCGCYDIARQACEVLWGHFVAEPPPPESVTYTTSAQKDFQLSLHRLNRRVVSQASPVLLRQFLSSIFINVDISVKNLFLFCDVICDKGPLYKGQINRLKECERMLVALELAGWLNEANLALQAVIQCYGLLAPLIFYKIPSVSVVQILERCLSVLQEIPSGLRQRRTEKINESLHHMTACLSYHMARVLRTWGQRNLANSVNEAGRKLLALEDPTKQDPAANNSNGIPLDTQEEEGVLTLAALKKKKTKKGPLGVPDAEGPVNEELKALEAHMLKLSKQAQGEHELTGNEDPSILHAYIAYLPSRIAYREVSKFKRRTRYLEFFVQVVQKALTEGIAEMAIEWCEDALQWIQKRNESIIGAKGVVHRQPGAMTIAGDDPKRFAAAMVEYGADGKTGGQTPRKDGGAAPTTTGKTSNAASRSKPRKKYKLWKTSNQHLSEQQRREQEEAEHQAIQRLSLFFPDMLRSVTRRRRFRKVCTEEMPWRCQLNILQGLSHFGVFLHKVETREAVMGNYTDNLYSTSYLDLEWFTLDSAGTVVVGWDGGPPRKEDQYFGPTSASRGAPTRTTTQESVAVGQYGRDYNNPTRSSGIELAAAAATGQPPAPMFPIPIEEEDTPRTYRSDIDDMGMPRIDNEAGLLSPKEAMESLDRTFDYFKKAVVLSHRGQHWTLLQNSCRALWNCAHTALMRTLSTRQHGSNAGSLIGIEQLRSLLWHPFFTATDCLLDMLEQMQLDREKQAAKAKSKGKAPDEEPTFFGYQPEEKGGAHLKFESPLDNLSTVDARWVRRIVERTIEILYHEGKWERLVDVALRFNALTNDRYAEQVIPLLVQAQRQLRDRLEEINAPSYPQAHFRKILKELGGTMTAKDYAQMQIRVEVQKDQLPAIHPGAHIDPEGHQVYQGKRDGLRLVSVPLDISYSLQVFREALDTSAYTSRALQHSRRLLVLYLAGQQSVSGQSGLGSEMSKVDFIPNTAKPQPTMPPDIRKEEYIDSDDVETAPLPRSQLGVVIASYDKTIEMLLSRNQKGLAAQAMHELGNLHYHGGNIRGAYKWWADALDVILNVSDALHTWKQLFTDAETISQELLQRCGLWGCVLGGVLASNIAQYILTSDLGLKMQSCFLSGYFFKALFRTSLPHPTADCDYALYEIGEGCEVSHLVPGIDLLSDRFRSEGRSVVAALRWVTEELARGKHNLFVLPMLTLYQYFTTFVCRDLQRSVDGRVLKVRVLTDLGLYSEALICLQRLLHGERLPHTADNNFRQVESKSVNLRFSADKPVLDPNNLKVLESVIDKRLSSNLAALYGPHMTCLLTLAQAHLLISVAEKLPVFPVLDDLGLESRQRTYTSLPRSAQRSGRPSVTSSSATKPSAFRGPPAGSSIDVEESDSETEGEKVVQKRFSTSKKPVTLEMVKGTLLGVSEFMLTTLSEILIEQAENDKGVETLAAAELELVVHCKLELSEVAKQRHHGSMAARTVLTAMKLLQGAELFTFKAAEQIAKRPSSMRSSRHATGTANIQLTQIENSQFQFQNFQSRSRLDARLWLNCRLALVKSLMCEVRGMGDVKGPYRSVHVELGDCRQYCVEGYAEAEACGDVEMQAEFLMQGVLLNIMEGKSSDDNIDMLKDILALLSSIVLSTSGQLLQTTAMVMLTDITTAATPLGKDRVDITEKTVKEYLAAQKLLLEQIQALGEKIEHYYPAGGAAWHSAPLPPMANTFLPHILLLAQIKLRIGHAMSRNAARNAGSEDIVERWTSALGVLTTALELCKVTSLREASLEAEILLNMGKVQRQLFNLGKYQARAVVSTLLDAIRTSYAFDHDLGLIRQGYLEIALVYLSSSGVVPQGVTTEDTLTVPEGSVVESAGESGDEVSSVKTGSSGKKSKKGVKSKKEKTKLKPAKEPTEGERDKERRAAWVAIRCAAAAGQAQRARLLLPGDVSVTSQPLSAKAQQDIPDFAVLDLISSYVFGEKKKVYKNAIEEEMAPLVESLEVQQVVETYQDEINKAREEAKGISWTHLLGYQAILQRMCSTATVISASAKKENEHQREPPNSTSDLGSEFGLGFFSHAEFDIALNHDVVRSTVLSGPISLRLTSMHQFFTSALQVYSAECCAIYPPVALQLDLPPDVSPTNVEIITKNYAGNLVIPIDQQPDGTPLAPVTPPGTLSPVHVHKPPDKSIVSTSDNEISLQWYQPAFEEHGHMPLRPQTSMSTGAADSHIALLYAVNKKADKVTGAQGLQPGLLWITLKQLIELHDRLALLMQRSEISLVEKPKKEPQPPSPTPSATGKTKKVARIKALSPKVKKDEHLENLLKQCLTDVQTLFGVLPELETVSEVEIPFEVTKANMHSFEKLFDPSFGFTMKGGTMFNWFSKLFTQ